MATVAAGMCPACHGWLMIVPETLDTGVWAWQCPTCTVIFATDIRGEGGYIEAGEISTEPGGFPEPEREHSEGTCNDSEEGDVAESGM